MGDKVMVLFSGGIDSTTCLGLSIENLFSMDRNMKKKWVRPDFLQQYESGGL